MMNTDNIPAAIKEARPHNFSITKNDLASPDNPEQNPEIYVRKLIWEWVTSITSELLRGKNPEAWQLYPEKFAHQIIKENELFPTTIPIGYVLTSFFRSVYPKYYRLDAVQQIFNTFIMAREGELRKDMAEAWRNGQMYVEKMTITPVAKEPDGKDKGRMLYDRVSQGEMKFGA